MGGPKNYVFRSRGRPYIISSVPSAFLAEIGLDSLELGMNMMHDALVFCFAAVLVGPGFYALRGAAWAGRISAAVLVLLRFFSRRLTVFGIDAARFTVNSLKKVEEIPAKGAVMNELQK
jgi:hypothetical protein